MKKYVLGIAMILAALSTALIYFLDNDPETNPNVTQTIEQVQDGIDTMKDEPKEVEK